MTIFGHTHSWTYWLLLITWCFAFSGWYEYRKRRGASKWLLYKVVGVFGIVLLIEMIVWKLVVMRASH
jgi:hypothetical protein